MAWTFPVIGKTEWSGGSWMPNTMTHRGRSHAAVDIYGTRGQSIVSPVSGKIKALGSSSIGGNWVQVEGNDGNVYYFAHMDQRASVKRGQVISGGQLLGVVGNSGSATSTRPHLHFSVKRDGKAISPVAMLQGGVVVPDISFTGEAGGSSPAPWNVGSDYWDQVPTQDEVLPQEAQQQAPPWFDQLNAYRAEMANQPQQVEDPVRQRATDVMRASLYGMSQMVQRSGFATDAGDGTGIDENTVTREAGER